MSTRQRRLAQLVNDPDTLPLLFNVDHHGHEYETDLLDLSEETTAIGISRAHQLKAIGNGACPQQALAAYSSMNPAATRQEIAA